ncbi:myeloid differentiation primary response 88 isoform X2 [Paramuricea clavata]|uniref:Myeloid differentiation primary response 88 isoform X2 n=1 Tax=Paramuricea clavata TaxID=317549 RepID=A0A7D9K2J3_PARCT|nr:myeloid differentiation primary response 88 isoform X2 [Paramuricea clavata]
MLAILIISADSAIGETVQPAVATVRKRKSSASFGERKVFFSRQISSNSNNGLDFSGESPGDAQTPAAVNELSAENAFEGKTLERKRTPSSSSGKIGRIFSRQNSAQKKGTTDETTSLLSTDYNDNVFLPEVVTPPAETSSSTAPHRLSGLKIGDLNAGTHQQFCRKLNLDIPNDWRTLAGDMKYNYEQVQEFAQDANPAKKLLDCWGTGEGHDVASLIKLVKGINRNDLVELLES